MKNKQKITSDKLILICINAFLAALSIVLGKYLAINLGETIRISFENLPILFAGLYFGPASGAAVAVVADLVGCVLVGYSINPIITLGAAGIGLISGLIGKSIEKIGVRRVLLTVFPAHLFGSVLIKTVGLYLYFQMPFFPTLGWRSLTYLIVGAAETTILSLLSKSQALTRETERIMKTEEKHHEL